MAKVRVKKVYPNFVFTDKKEKMTKREKEKKRKREKGLIYFKI